MWIHHTYIHLDLQVESGGPWFVLAPRSEPTEPSHHLLVGSRQLASCKTPLPFNIIKVSHVLRGILSTWLRNIGRCPRPAPVEALRRIPPGRTPWSLSLLANLASEILNLIMVATPSSSRFAQASAHVNSGRLPRGGPASRYLPSRHYTVYP